MPTIRVRDAFRRSGQEVPTVPPLSARNDVLLFAVLAPWAIVGWLLVAGRGELRHGVIAAACYTVAVCAVPFRRTRIVESAAVTFASFAVLAVTNSQLALGIFPLLLCVPLTVMAVVEWHPRRWVGVLTALTAVVGALWSPEMYYAADARAAFALHAAVIGMAYLWASRRRVGRENAVREKERAVGRASTAERERIAEELHDGLGHALTAIRAKSATAVAGGRDPERMADALEVIAQLSAESLRDLRGTLEMLTGDDRDAGSLRRTLADLGRLDVELTCVPEEDAVDEIDANLDSRTRAVVRGVIEEAVINVIRHNAAGCPVEVTFDPIRRPGRTEMLAVEIANPVRPPAADTRGSGRGLPALRQRVSDLGGVAAVNDGAERFTVKAVLPVRAIREGAHG